MSQLQCQGRLARKQIVSFKLKNREFSFDVDVSNLPCGLNGAVYFVAMDAKGEKGIGANALVPNLAWDIVMRIALAV